MKTRSRGLTLIELMVALMVVSILVGLAVPSFREMTANSRTSAAMNNLVTALTMARSEALKRGTVTRVCSTTDQADCAGSNDWTTGWLVFVDTDNNNSVGANELLQTFPAVEGGVLGAATANVVSYSSLGMSMNPAVTFTFTPPYCTGDRQGRVVVSVAGSAQSSKVACP